MIFAMMDETPKPAKKSAASAAVAATPETNGAGVGAANLGPAACRRKTQ
eukprot:SAG22_NODE_173_length_16589_cov_120.738933_14_plen_49_part_00